MSYNKLAFRKYATFTPIEKCLVNVPDVRRDYFLIMPKPKK